MKDRVLITRPGWFLTENGHPVTIQYWDHNFQPFKGAFWRGMVVLEVEDRTIRDWKCIWYTVYGDGFFPDYRGNCGEWDIVRVLNQEEIPVSYPLEWMPAYEATVNRRMRAK